MELISTHPVKKSDLGFHGNLFGGKLLAWIDAAGASFAAQVADTPRMVTVAIDKCIFKKYHLVPVTMKTFCIDSKSFCILTLTTFW